MLCGLHLVILLDGFLETFVLFYCHASWGARVSLLMDRLASSEVTVWQTLLSTNATWPDILVMCHETELLSYARDIPWENQ